MAMAELPLFPLNSVLFPGMPLKLHIFEERYKLMINECIDKHLPFGVVLIESGTDSMGPLARPHSIGCTAHITQVQRLPFGRMNILAMGRERFRINTLHADKAYLIGDIDYIPLKQDDRRMTAQGARRLAVLLKKYLGTLENAGQLHFDESQLPTDALSLGYLAAVVLQTTDMEDKQKLLAAETTTQLMRELNMLYQREVALLEIMLSQVDVTNGDTPFSLN
jgi:uncharacterized protein